MDVSLYFLYPVPSLGKSFHTPYLSSMADFHDGVDGCNYLISLVVELE
jgi:hypothetical protein